MNLLKKYITNTGPKPYFKNKNLFNKFLIGENLTYLSFGNKNKSKIFYIINRSPGSGLFSNLTFILNHLRICDKFNFIPIIDMKNFTTIYNEKSKISDTYNSWEYYFKSINIYSLDEIYTSKNVIISSPKFQRNMFIDMADKRLNKYIQQIKIKQKFINKVNLFINKNFLKKDKILGVHFRGSTYKTARRHAYPATISEMIHNIDELIKKYKYNKIFLVTEENGYLNNLKEKYKDKIIYYPSYRMSKIDTFKIYPRKNHRYKVGCESLIETLILSKCDGLTYIKSNIISAAKIFSKKKQYDHEIFFGYNSRNKYIARWLWYLKVYFPFIFGPIKKFKKYY